MRQTALCQPVEMDLVIVMGLTLFTDPQLSSTPVTMGACGDPELSTRVRAGRKDQYCYGVGSMMKQIKCCSMHIVTRQGPEGRIFFVPSCQL